MSGPVSTADTAIAPARPAPSFPTVEPAPFHAETRTSNPVGFAETRAQPIATQGVWTATDPARISQPDAGWAATDASRISQHDRAADASAVRPSGKPLAGTLPMQRALPAVQVLSSPTGSAPRLDAPRPQRRGLVLVLVAVALVVFALATLGSYALVVALRGGGP
jgi:hypothetical protein